MDTEEKAETMSEAERSELQLLYEVSVTDIANFKQQQWSLTNYSLLIQAGLVGVSALLPPSPQLSVCPSWALLVLVTLTAVGSVFILCGLQHSIAVRRERMGRIRKHFSNKFNEAWKVSKKPDYVLHFLITANIVAGLVASGIIIARL